MTYIYLLSDYEEHGSEHMVATLDRDKLFGLIENQWGAYNIPGLQELLKKPDEELDRGCGWNCPPGWGGPQLHVVKLIP